jgi:hypothetical protein
MATEKKAFTLYLTDEASNRIREIAKDRGVRVNDAIRLGLGLLDIAERARERGEYVGASRQRENLSTVFVSPL